MSRRWSNFWYRHPRSQALVISVFYLVLVALLMFTFINCTTQTKKTIDSTMQSTANTTDHSAVTANTDADTTVKTEKHVGAGEVAETDTDTKYGWVEPPGDAGVPQWKPIEVKTKKIDTKTGPIDTTKEADRQAVTATTKTDDKAKQVQTTARTEVKEDKKQTVGLSLVTKIAIGLGLLLLVYLVVAYFNANLLSLPAKGIKIAFAAVKGVIAGFRGVK